MRRRALLVFALAVPLRAQFIVKLAPQTLDEFQAYVTRVESGMRERWTGRQPFLWLDENPEARQNVRKGEIVVKAQGSQDGNPITGGLVHDWLGAMFIPGARMEQVEAVIQDFDLHKKYYSEVIDSKTLRREGSTIYGHWRLRKKKVLTVELNAELEVHQESAGSARWYTRSYTVHMNEIVDAGTPQERELPDGQGHGFLWRLNAYWRLEQQPDGVFAECHTLSLSRDVPSGLGWIIRPIIRDLPRQSLIDTLKSTALAAKSAPSGHGSQPERVLASRDQRERYYRPTRNPNAPG